MRRLAQSRQTKIVLMDRRIGRVLEATGSLLYMRAAREAAWMWRRCWLHSIRWSRLCWQPGF